MLRRANPFPENLESALERSSGRVLATVLGAVLAVCASPAVAQGDRAGRLDVISGLDFETVLISYVGTEPGDEFGASAGADLLPGGSVDATRDWLIGAPGAAGGSGRVWAVRPTDGARLFSLGADLAGGTVERFGHQIAALGHVDGRQFVDWAVGAPSSAESETPPAVVVLREASGVLRESYRLEGPKGSLFGWVVRNLLEDVDGDRNFEFVVSSPRENRKKRTAAGAVRVFSSATGKRLYTVRGKKAHENLGYSVAVVDDHDGDGVDDLLVGAPGNGSRKLPGYVLLISGSTGEILERIEAPAKARHFGLALRRLLVDLDADGRNDWIIGAPGHRKAKGAAFVISSNDLSILKEIRGRKKKERLGIGFQGLNVLSDLDSDGLREINVRSLLSDPDRPDRDQRGRVIIYSLGSGSVLHQREGAQAFDRIGGGATGSALDFDGDGSFDPLLAFLGTPLPCLP